MTTAAATLNPPSGLRILALRFLGYLSADGLNYGLGFLIYGWLIRILTTQQYGQLGVATSIYQPLMMIAALGLDLTGVKLIRECGNCPSFARKAQQLRLAVAGLICGPLELGAALFAWHRGHDLLAVLILASFSMVLARALDLTYLAVALRAPAPLARTRALGLSVYLLLLVACTPAVRQHLWLVPVLNAIGVTLGRIRLGRLLRRLCPASAGAAVTRSWQIVVQGSKAGGGQLLLLVLQTGDVVLLARYVSGDALGQYAMVSRLYLLAMAVLAAMFNTFLPEIVQVAHDWRRLQNIFQTCILANLGLGIAGGAAFCWLGAPIFELLGHRSLPLVHVISPVFALVFLLMSIANPFLSILPSLKLGTGYFIGVASAALLLAGFDLTFIPRYGSVAAAWGQVLLTAYLAGFSIAAWLRHIRVLRSSSSRTVADPLVAAESPW
ncbi:MAG TPA: oligosaccharide flippase family protein [Candidatus Binatia bacterium]|nr:oligosaccharide flippase family protein [Candidatus Binatia bacterium]